MSWLSQTIKSGKVQEITWDKALRAIPGVGNVIANEAKSHKIESTVASAQHLAKSAYEQIQRIAQSEGISELEAMQRFIKRADDRFTGWRIIEDNKTWILLAIAAVVLFLILGRRR